MLGISNYSFNLYIRIKNKTMNIDGYNKVTYKGLQSQLQKKYAEYRTDKGEMDLALAIKVQSPQTVRNAFNNNMQVVSDAILTNIMDTIGFDGFTAWVGGRRYYYVKNK